MKTTPRNGAPDLDVSSIDYEAIADPGHGNSVAAWAGVFSMLFGISVAAVGNVIDSQILFWIGAAIAVIGLIVGFALRAAGKGRQKNGH